MSPQSEAARLACENVRDIAATRNDSMDNFFILNLRLYAKNA
ncbi:MAG: hypothetical protein ACI8XW_001503 [Gammaproteobacteria bacterium]